MSHLTFRVQPGKTAAQPLSYKVVCSNSRSFVFVNVLVRTYLSENEPAVILLSLTVATVFDCTSAERRVATSLKAFTNNI